MIQSILYGDIKQFIRERLETCDLQGIQKYGAGDAKIGEIVGGTAEHGAELRKKFLKATPAIKKLQQSVKNLLSTYNVEMRQREWKTRYLKGLDGRLLYTRSIHSALNLLLQSAGAIVCKYWIVRTEERLLNLGLDHGKDFQLMAWVHRLHCAH